MAKVPGVFDGQRYDDLRMLIPNPIKAYYVSRGTWDDIVKYRSYEHSEVVTVKIPHGFRKDKWQNTYGIHGWHIADDEFTWKTDLELAKKR